MRLPAPCPIAEERAIQSRSGDAVEAPPPIGSGAMRGGIEDENGRYGPGANQFVTKHFPVLALRLHGKFPLAPYDSVTSAVNEALLDYLERVRRRDPVPDDLVEGYLYVASWRNLRDILRSEKRRRLREALYANEAPQRSLRRQYVDREVSESAPTY